MKNEKGSALLTVMLTMLILTTLGLVIISVSLQGAKRTVIREDNIIENTDALTNLKLGIALIESLVEQNKDWVNETNYHQDILDAAAEYEDFIIEDLTDKYEEKTRVFSVKDSNGIYEQKVYVTAMPSFLKYAVGARNNLTINGSVKIEGDIYAYNQLDLSNKAQYIYNGPKEIITSLPSISNDRFVVLANEETFSILNEKEQLFDSGDPFISLDKEGFIEANILSSFIEKLNTEYNDTFSCSDVILIEESEKKDCVQRISDQLTTLHDNYIKYIFDENNEHQMLNIKYPLELNGLKQTIYYFQGNTLIDESMEKIKPTDWVIINGNASFSNDYTNELKVEGNYLVTGKVDLMGNLQMNSVIYALGDTTLYNANINPNQTNPSFILMTEGNLELANLNEFKSPDEDTTIITGFLYTTKKATIYGVGSLLKIYGGIFSQSDLTLNAYRGEAEDDQTDLRFIPNENEEYSRLQVTNNKRLYIDQDKLYALPIVDQLDVITDRINKLK